MAVINVNERMHALSAMRRAESTGLIDDVRIVEGREPTLKDYMNALSVHYEREKRVLELDNRTNAIQRLEAAERAAKDALSSQWGDEARE